MGKSLLLLGALVLASLPLAAIAWAPITTQSAVPAGTVECRARVVVVNFTAEARPGCVEGH